ncbi:MAG: PAS domain-containing sensor histidine kinase [Bacteroidota bacterium]|nr:PAS domain-containing sensor histidine kinase [Bacteroidota bacterium]
MGLSNIDKKRFSDLRKMAEGKTMLNEKNKSSFDERELTHELDVHNVELQMQNEELLETQIKLIKSIEEYTELFEYSPIGYFILDKDGVVLKVNKTGLKLLEVNKKQILTKHFSIFLNSKSFQDEFYRHKNLVIETKITQQFEARIKKNDGSVFFALIETCLVKDENNLFKFLLCTITDISVQKAQERVLAVALKKERELNKMKSKFITIASHEFRTPLSTILTSAELIEKYDKPEDSEKKIKHFDKIKSSVNRLKEILMDFMSAGEVEQGKIHNNPEIFNMVALIKQWSDEIKPFNAPHSHKYIHTGQYENVYLDKKLLKICFTNLLVNAYKYSPKGGIIEITTEQNTAGIIYMSIKDKGIGIPEADKVNIFHQFYRAKNAEAIQGTGLGLNITHELIGIMGGEISFVSKVNKGTIFTIKFPRKDSSNKI